MILKLALLRTAYQALIAVNVGVKLEPVPGDPDPVAIKAAMFRLLEQNIRKFEILAEAE